MDKESGIACGLLLFIIAIATLIQGVIVYFAWNWLLIDIIGVNIPDIAFWQAILVGLVISILFNHK